MSEWIEWDGSKGGYPETLDTRVEVRFGDGTETDEDGAIRTVNGWRGLSDRGSNWNWGTEEPSDPDIVAYRVLP